MTQQLIKSVAVVLAAGVVASVGFGAVGAAPCPAEPSDPAWPPSISPYWSSRIQRWDRLIVHAAARRELDPDLLASLIWMESRGDSHAIGPRGAVGLMQIMPKEAGFTWRPSRAVLLDPGTNVAWGSGTLATVVKQGEGDVFSALAAYNGGWNNITSRGPKRFASTILRDYANAVAARHDLEGEWTAFFAVRGEEIAGPLWVAGAARDDVYCYGDHNRTPAGSQLIPPVAPASIVARGQEQETERTFVVGLWLYNHANNRWVTPQPADGASATTPALSSSVGSQLRPAMGNGLQSPTVSGNGGGDTLGKPDGARQGSVASTCVPGAARLSVDTWPLERERTSDGWRVRVFAEARGGDCSYVYAWNDLTDVRSAVLRGPITFDVATDREADHIVGTLVVQSGDEVVRTGIYISSP